MNLLPRNPSSAPGFEPNIEESLNLSCIIDENVLLDIHFSKQVKSKEQPDYAGRFKFVIEMYDTSGAEDFNLAQELVYRNLASPTDDSSLTVSIYSKFSKTFNPFLFLFSNKMYGFKAVIHKMLVRTACLIRLLLQAI